MIKFGTGGWREIIATASAGGRGGPDRLRLPALLHQPLLPHAAAPPPPRPRTSSPAGRNSWASKVQKEHVIARAAGPHPRVASLALRAIHLLAIPWIFRLPNWCDLLSTGLPHQCAHWFAMTCLFFREAPSELSLTALPRGV